MDLYWKRELGQLSQNDHNDITLTEAALRKYKADLKQEEAARKLQKKFRVNQKRKIQANEKQIGVKLLKKLQKEEKQVDTEELITAISRMAISGSAVQERHRSELIQTEKTLEQLTEAFNRKNYNLKRPYVYLCLLSKNRRTTKPSQQFYVIIT